MESKVWFVVYDLFEVMSDGTVNYLPGYTPERAKQAFEKDQRTYVWAPPFDFHGPAIEGHEIAVVKKIEEK
jgi:hypothetical protein